MKTLIKNGYVIDPANKIEEVMDILIEGGRIKEVAPSLTDTEAQIIDAKGMWVTPGLIDMHVHLRDPGYRHKETIKTGTASAAIGGFTTICPMANTDPVTDNEIVVEYITSKAKKEGYVHVLPIGAVTKNLEGQELAAIGDMAEAGICAVSDDGNCIENPAVFKTAMKYIKMFDLPVLAHCEDKRLVGKGQINAGVHADIMGFKGIAIDSEEIVVARDIVLAKLTGVHLHICHVSATGSLNQIRAAKAEGQALSCEVTPHHFTLCDEDITDYDSNFKMSPPLRSRADVAALKVALKDGTIDVIATDHAPHHIDDKNCEFELAQNGVIGLETALPLCITELVNTGILTPMELITKLTINPAKVLKLKKGTLTPGYCADITIIDPNHEYTIDKDKFESKARNTPFHGRKVKGKAMYTIVKGKIVVAEGKLNDNR